METGKILLFLATERGYTVLQKAVQKDAVSIGCVVSFPETNVAKSWHEDIFELCRQNGIRSCLWQDIKNDIEKFIRDGDFYTAIAVSWKYLIPLSINKYMNYGLIVFHDSLLPHYRGFAPTPTAILNGETEIGVTALFAAEEVDRGDILLQRKMSVPRDQYIQEIITRQADLYGEMFCTLMTQLQEGNLTAVQQDESQASYSIWRSPEDCEIDWTKPAEQIYDFIRAVGAPYPGAYTYYMGRKIVIERSEVCEDKLFEVRDAGKIWSLRDNRPEVICGAGMLRILQAREEDGKSVQFTKLRCKMTPGDTLNGQNVVLRPITMADTPLIVRWRNTPSVRENFIFREPFTNEMHEHWMRTKVAGGEVVQYIIEDAAACTSVGSVYFRDIDPHNKSAEYGIFIGEESARGKGFGTETARLFVDFGFRTLGLHRISLRVLAGNTAARKSYERAGFVREGCFRDMVYLDGAWHDVIFMAILAKDWQIKKDEMK